MRMLDGEMVTGGALVTIERVRVVNTRQHLSAVDRILFSIDCLNIALTILQNQSEEFSQLDVGRSCFNEAEISPLGPRERCIHRASRMRFT